MGFGQERIDFFEQLIQLLGKPIYTNKWKIRKNMASNLLLPTSGNQVMRGKAEQASRFEVSVSYPWGSESLLSGIADFRLMRGIVGFLGDVDVKSQVFR